MAFCPECEAEYREGITTCRDCEVNLVPELPQEPPVHVLDDIRPVPFRVFPNSAEAEMVNQLLRQNGVSSFVKGSGFSVFPGSFSLEVVLMVDEQDLERAARIYEAYFDSGSTAPFNED